MNTEIIEITNNFWNIRGSFKIKGLIDIGTHASLVKLASGKFVFLDSLTLDNDTLEKVNRLTKDGDDLEAVINLQPFHTVHTEWMHKTFPNAKHYGTKRHLEKFPSLNWEEVKSEDEKLHKLYSSDLEFSVPKGVDFIPEDENLHFSSVLAYHPSSKTIHVDDTLMYIQLPALLKFFGVSDHLGFHPTLSKVLQKRSGAADEFNLWAKEMAASWAGAKNLCTAHKGNILENEDRDLHKEILKAIESIQIKLNSHRNKYT